jgi:hypothetical protein
MFSTLSVQRRYKKDNWNKNRSFGKEPAFREDLSPEAEEEPLLEAVFWQLLVKILQAGEDLACALVNC